MLYLQRILWIILSYRLEKQTMAESSDDSEGSGQRYPSLEYYNLHEDEDTDQPIQDEPVDTSEEPNFDPVLTTQHSYLGHGEEISGRTVLEEGSTVELPLLYDSAVMLVPGQTLPLSVFHPAFVAMLRRVIADNRTFGFINTNCVQPENSAEPTIGTTAEIYEVKDHLADSYSPFAVKAKGRQRFRLLSTRSTVDGTKVGLARILSDELPIGPFTMSRPRSLWRYRLPTKDRSDADPASRHPRADPNGRRHRLSRMEAATGRWPGWLYQLYELEWVTERARADVQRCLLCSADSVPGDPVKLSYWVAMSLPLDDAVRARLLRLDSVVRRLRCEINIMQSFNVMLCAECEQPVASFDHVFSMSAEGPQGIFVNPNGHLHETLTLRRASGLRCITRPSSEFCWFPGYVWEIAQCANCSSHMGWRFSAEDGELRPQSFWGICRRSLTVRPPDAGGADGDLHRFSRLVL